MALDLSNNILIYTSGVIASIILVVLIYFFIQSKAGKLAKKILSESLESQGYRLEEHHGHKKPQIEKKLIDEAIFFIGLAVSITGFLLKNYAMLLAGIFISILSVFVLHFILKSGKHSLMSAIKDSEGHVQPMLITKQDNTEISNEEKETLKRKISAHKITILKDKDNQKENSIEKFLKIADELLERLPEHEVSSFAASSEFDIYRRLMKEHPQEINEDLRKLAPVIDSLLGKLPREEISKFSKSSDFKLYENIMGKIMKNGPA